MTPQRVGVTITVKLRQDTQDLTNCRRDWRWDIHSHCSGKGVSTLLVFTEDRNVLLENVPF